MGRGLSPDVEQFSAIVPSDLSRSRAFSTVASLSALPDGLNFLSPEDALVRTDEVLGWMSGTRLNNQPVLQPIREHLHRCKHVVRADGDSVVEPARWQSWGWQANVIWVTDDDRVLDPAGRLLIDARGCDPDPLAVIPFPVDARQRQKEAAVLLRNRLVDPVSGILPVRGEHEIEVIAPSEVARRALALFLVATRAESVLSGQPLDAQRMRARCPLGYAAMSPDELAFFEHQPTADTQSGTAHSDWMDAASSMIWRYESLATLQWALAMQFELPWPDDRADLTAVTRLMIDLPDAEIVEHARLRTTAELLDAAELHHQALHTIATAQQAETSSADSFDTRILDPGIVCERLAALAWICRLAPAASNWDETMRWVEGGGT